MAATVLELAAWRDALVKARATGAQTVTHDRKTVIYRSLADMDAIIADLNGQIAGFGDDVVRVRTFRVNHKNV